MVGLFSASQPLASLAASAALGAGLPPGLTQEEAEGELLKYVLPLVILVSHGVGWSALYYLIGRRHHLPLGDGLTLHGLRRLRVVRIFGAGMALQVLGVMTALLVPPPEDFDNPVLRFIAYGGWAVALLFLMAVIMAPLLEEALFRGVLLPALRRRLRFVPAALLVTVLFTALHAVQTSGYWPPLLVIALVGYLLAYLREASGSLWPPILFHMGFNFTALLPVLLLGDELPLAVLTWLQASQA